MPTLTVNKTYIDGNTLDQSDLNNAFDSISGFINSTKLDSSNIQVAGIATSNIAANAITSTLIASGAVGSAQMAASAVGVSTLTAAAQACLVPTGAVLPYAAPTAPSGFLICDGTAYSRTTYATLFALIGITHGQGDGVSTFNVPDYRGRFLRGIDSGIGRDPNTGSRTAMATGGNTGDAVGSVQAQATAVNGLHDTGHVHSPAVTGIPFGSGYLGDSGNSFSGAGSAAFSAAGNPFPTASGTASLAGDSETRPVNAYVQWIIKT